MLQEAVVVCCMVLPAFACQTISVKVLTQVNGAALLPRIHIEILEYRDTEC